MLQSERIAVTKRLIVVKRQIRAGAAEAETLEMRLRDISESEANLSGGDR